jgi:hypothetical protein
MQACLAGQALLFPSKGFGMQHPPHPGRRKLTFSPPFIFHRRFPYN